MRGVRFAGIAASLGALFGAFHPALGQTAKDEAVLNRARPDFDPFGIELDELLGLAGLVDRATIERKSSPLASFSVFPTLGVAERYESNLFRERIDARSDLTTIVSPGIAIRSDWTNHSLALTANADLGYHKRFSSEDYQDFTAGVAGNIEMTDELAFAPAISHRRAHEERGSINDLGAGFPLTRYDVTTVNLTANYRPEGFLTRGIAQIDRYAYSDAGTVSNAERDRMEARLSARAGYEFTPGTSVFVEPSVNTRNYELTTDAAGFRRSSDGYEVLVGAAWDLAGLLYAELAVGYLQQRYDDPRFPMVSGPSFAGTFIWNPNPLYSLTASLRRAVQDTQAVAFAGVLATTSRLQLDYEMWDNLTLSAGAAYANQDFEGTSRVDDVFGASLGATYRIGRNFDVVLSVDETRRRSTDAFFDYTTTTATVRLISRL